MHRNWVVIGSGGHGREIAAIVDLHVQENGGALLGFIDDDPLIADTVVGDLPILGDINWLCEGTEPLAIAMGIENSVVRKRLVNQLKSISRDLTFPPLVHPHASIGPRVTIGEGTIIQAGCVLSCDIQVGSFAVVNIGTIISHNNILGDFATIAPGSILADHVLIGELAEVGSGTCVIPMKKLGASCETGAGTVVIRDVPKNCRVVGVPAHPLSPSRQCQSIPTVEQAMSSKDIIIIGAGSYGEVIADLAITNGYSITEFFDDDKSKSGAPFIGYPVYHMSELLDHNIQGKFFAVAIGNNSIRRNICNSLLKRGAKLPSLVHPKSVISPRASIGRGCFIHAQALIWSACTLGDFSIMSPNSLLAHHSQTDEAVFIASGASVGAGVHICEEALIGVGATISTGVHRLGNCCLIGAGNTVIRDVLDFTTVVGCPAKPIRTGRSGAHSVMYDP